MTASIIAIIIGIAFLIWANKRSFDRRNEQGVELHNSYFGMLGAKAGDVLIGLVGAVIAIGGVVVMIYDWT